MLSQKTSSREADRSGRYAAIPVAALTRLDDVRHADIEPFGHLPRALVIPSQHAVSQILRVGLSTPPRHHRLRSFPEPDDLHHTAVPEPPPGDSTGDEDALEASFVPGQTGSLEAVGCRQDGPARLFPAVAARSTPDRESILAPTPSFSEHASRATFQSLTSNQVAAMGAGAWRVRRGS